MKHDDKIFKKTQSLQVKISVIPTLRKMLESARGYFSPEIGLTLTL